MTSGKPAMPGRCTRQVIGAALILFLQAGCNRGGKEPVAPLSMQLTSASMPAGKISRDVTCDGQGRSPQLAWSAPPPATQSLTLVMTDRDAPLGYNFVHWVLYNIPAGTRELPPDVPVQENVLDGAVQGLNDKKQQGYTAPCPHGKSPHRYDFDLYALDERVTLHAASKKQLLDAIQGHVLARGELIGRYGHS